MNFLRIFVVTVSFFAIGCGDGKVRLYPTSGRVTVNGRPVEGVIVSLHPVASGGQKLTHHLRPFGTTNSNGEFVLTSYQQDDGAPAGEYRVIVVWPKDPSDLASDRFGLKYAYSDKSQWTVQVLDEPTVLPPLDIAEATLDKSR